ncbi:acyltransferase family protein [Planctomycetes bacterium K23_9]|uniref:O-acetyltransferase OatA n=1 Tax=Stieleria marina TaxID=1930275 RepID=A0A517NZ26_9BACT|nr:O-acetyltransferase OatA [Planctomycetes bacterium K23_9]
MMNDSSHPNPTDGSLDPTFFSTGTAVVLGDTAGATDAPHDPSAIVATPSTATDDSLGRTETQTVIRPQLPPKPATARYDTLDVVRGMACLMLMFYHATFYAERSWSTGDPSTWTLGGLGINLVGRLWMGVPMFFVVSGYCIAASIDSLRRKPHSLVNYFYRRIRRIYPPLWGGFVFAILFTLVVGLSSTLSENCLQLPRLASFTLTDWLANFSATTSWFPKVVGGESNHLLLNTWTLCYEEQFYAVAGILLVLASRRFFLASYLIAGATLITRHVCRFYGVPINGFFFDGHWLLFVCGILVYQRINYLTGKPARAAMIAMAVGAVYGLSERVFAIDAHDRHVGEYILVACTFGIFLSYIKRWDKKVAQHWTLAPFRWSGKISYSLYLTHFPITVFVASFLAMGGVTSDADVLRITLPACLILSFPVAYVFYLLVERRYLNAPIKKTS